MYAQTIAGLFLFLTLFSPLLAIRIHCNHPEKIREDHIHYCCKHPDGHDDIVENCADENNFKLPSRNEEDVEDATVDQVMHGLCWGECVFKKFGFLKNQKLNMNAVRRHYTSQHTEDPEYMREMIASFDHCHGQAENATTYFINKFSGFVPNQHCDPEASVILSCVIYNFFHNCPKDRWAHTPECNDTLKFSKKCKDALATM